MLGRIRLEDVYLSTETSTVFEGQIDPLYNVLKKEGWHKGYEQGEKVGKRESSVEC